MSDPLIYEVWSKSMYKLYVNFNYMLCMVMYEQTKRIRPQAETEFTTLLICCGQSEAEDGEFAKRISPVEGVGRRGRRPRRGLHVKSIGVSSSIVILNILLNNAQKYQFGVE